MAAHQHDHHHDGTGTGRRRALRFALVLNAAYLGVELVVGLAIGSLSLLADAAHMASDVGALAIALVAQHLLARPPTRRHSYGLQRADVLGAQANGIVLLVAAGWIMTEAVRRLDAPNDVAGGWLLLVALVGLLVNLVSLVVLRRSAGGSLNMRAAVVHMGLDAAGSLGAAVAGAAALWWDADEVDPAMSIVVAALVLWSAWKLLRSTAHVLLEGTPPGVDPAEVTRALLAAEGVDAVHHLHVWSLASDLTALSAHVVLQGEQTLHEAQQAGYRLKGLLEARFGIGHATLELECHPCDPPDHPSSQA